MTVFAVFSTYDAVVKAFAPPFLAPNKGAAIRMFADAANEEKSNLRKHASDYSLFLVASFDDQSGAFALPSAPERVITAQEVLQDEVPPGFAR